MQDLSRMSDAELRALYEQSQGGPAPVAPSPAAPIIVRRANPVEQQQREVGLQGDVIANRRSEATLPYDVRQAAANATKAEIDAANAAREAAQARPAGAGGGANALVSLGRIIGQIDAIRNDVAGGGQAGWGETGATGSALRNWSGTAAYDLQSAIDTIDANSAFSALAEMRASNPTGGALGSITEKELALLRSTIANLDPNQSQDTFLSQLDIARRHYQTMLGQAGAAATPQDKEVYLNNLITQNAPSAEMRAAAGVVFGENSPNATAWLQRYDEGNRDPVAVVGDGGTGGNGGGGINPSQGDISARDGNPLDSFFRSAANMATGGFGNKIAAGINAVLPIDRLTGRPVRSVWDNRTLSDAINPIESISRLGDAFNRNLALETRTTNADRTANPLASVAGDVTGGVMAAGLAARYAPGVASARALSLPALGFDAAYGATVAGNEAFDRGQSVLPAAGMGAGVGAIGGTLGRGVIAPLAGRALATRPGQTAANAALAVANAPRNAVRGMMGRSPVAAPRVTPPPAVSPQQALLARNVADPAAAGATLGQAQGLGLPMALADTSPALRRLAGAAFRRSGDDVRNAAEATVSSRSMGQADRALGQIESNFGPISNPNRVSEDLLSQARNNSRPFYEAFRAEPARTSDTLDQILRTGEGQAALNRAYQLADTERVDPLAMGFDLDAQGNVMLTRAPSPATLDYVKRGFDDTINGYKDLFGNINLNDQGRAVEGLRQAFVSEMDRLYPNTYPAARAAYAGPASEREALNMGRDAMRRQPRDIADQMERYSPTQQEQYRLGARVAMGDRVSATADTRNPYNALYGSTVARDRLSAMYPQPNVNRFGQAFDIEADMSRTAQELLGGSPTASRQMADQEFGNSAMDHLGTGIVDIITAGGPWRAALNVGRNMLGDRMQLGLGQAAQRRADALLPDLLNTDPAAARAIMDEAIANSTNRANFNGRMRRVGGMFGYGAAGTALPLLSQ